MKLKIARLEKGLGLFHLGFETWRYVAELHHPWGSSSPGATQRIFILYLGFWNLVITDKDSL